MKKILSQSFFDRSVVEVAYDLVGCVLVRSVDGKIKRYLIVETEAYDGCDDLACHASKGRTKRTETMYGASGHMYIYLVYGMHYMLNIVTGPVDYPAAVLIRGIQEIENGEKRIDGPGRVTKTLDLTTMSNGKKLGKESGVWIEESVEKIPTSKIEKTPRIGIDYAGPIWSMKKWRFVLKLSKRKT